MELGMYRARNSTELNLKEKYVFHWDDFISRCDEIRFGLLPPRFRFRGLATGCMNYWDTDNILTVKKWLTNFVLKYDLPRQKKISGI